MTQLYTPFMAQAGKTIGNAITQRRQNKLYSSAYMNEPGAMEQLMQVNPQMAYQIQQQKQQSEQLELSRAAKKEEGIKKLFSDNKEIIDQVVEDVSKFETFEEAKNYFDRKKEEYQPIFGDTLNDVQLTEQMFNESKAVYGDGDGDGKQGAEQKRFTALTEGMTGEDLEKARRIALGLDSAAPKIFQSSAKTFNIGGVPHILDAEGKVHKINVDGQDITTTVVANSKREIVEATESGKLSTQLKFKPMISEAVKLAEIKAKEKGEVLSDLGRMEASLPGVKQVVDELIELSTMSTSTIGGRAFDALLKESGFGSTKGADARAKLIAIVDNQVLPLLRETFGAAFTKAEGDTLRMALVDPDASPSQKKEQLESFLAQKERNVIAKQKQLDDMNKIEISNEDLQKLSDDELFN